MGTTSRRNALRIPVAAIEPALIASFLALVFVDLCLPNINVAILYAIPFLMAVSFARSRQRRWLYAAVYIAAVYLLYILKYAAIGGQPVQALLTFRLLNRTFVAIALALLGLCATAWNLWQRERSFLHLQEKAEEDEVVATAGVIGCIGLGLIVAAAEMFAPAKLNLPILLLVPLYLVSWLESKRMLWYVVAAMIAVTWLGYFLTLAPVDADLAKSLAVNRLIVSAALLGVAGLLSRGIERRRRLSDSC
jgi:hypothetical protein